MAGSQAAGLPTAQQVGEALIDRIADGRWGKTAPLPELSDLARELNATPETVSAALEQLHADKFISRRGDGHFLVTDVQAQALTVRFSNLFATDGTRVSGEAIESSMEAGEASPMEAARLRIAEGDPVCRVHRIRHHRGRRFMVELASLPLSVFPGLMDSGRVPFRVPILCKRYGLTVRRAEEHVSLGVASANVAVALGVRYGTPLFVLDRVLHVADGTPVEYRIGHTLMTDFKYVTSWGPAQALE